MAQKASESVLRELIKSLNDLTKKVSDLECKINEQNSKISQQTDTIARLKSAVTGTSTTASQYSEVAKTSLNTAQTQPNTSAAPAPPAVQRTIRQAKLNAKTAMSAAGKSRQSILVSPHTDVTRRDPKATTPSPSNTATKTASNPTPPEPARKETKVADVICVATKPESTEHDRVTKNNDWQNGGRKRPRINQRKIVTGSGEADSSLQTVEKLKFIQAWSFRSDTTEGNVLQHLKKVADCDKYVVNKREIKSDAHAVFVIGFPSSLYDKLYSPTSWPSGVKISDWFPRRPRHTRRGAATADRPSFIDDVTAALATTISIAATAE